MIRKISISELIGVLGTMLTLPLIEPFTFNFFILPFVWMVGMAFLSHFSRNLVKTVWNNPELCGAFLGQLFNLIIIVGCIYLIYIMIWK